MVEIRKAIRSRAKLRIGLAGIPGSGKSYSALLLAKGLAGGDMSKVVVIDTEQGSADLYSHLGGYSVIPLEKRHKEDEDTYAPERYIDAIKAAENAGFEICIIDSVTPEWDSAEGGLVLANERIADTKFKGNSWAAWSDTKPRHQKFLYAITGSKMHMIMTVKNKPDQVQTEGGKVKKIGLKQIQQDTFEYELTATFDIDQNTHTAIASKDRTSMFDKKTPFVITERIGQEFKEWAEQGVDPKIEEERKQKMAAEQKAAAEAEEKEQQLLVVKKEILELCQKLGFVTPTKESGEFASAFSKFLLETTKDEVVPTPTTEKWVDIRNKLAIKVSELAPKKEVDNEGNNPLA